MPNQIYAMVWVVLFLITCFSVRAIDAAHGPGVQHHGPVSIASMIKTVPEAATLEYRVKGQIVQSIDIRPGVYKIVVELLK
jgi:hypothetical protein